MFEIIQSAQAEEILEIGNLTISVSLWPYLFAMIKYFLIFMTILFIVGIILILSRVEAEFKVRINESVEKAIEMGKISRTKSRKEWEAILYKLNSDDSQDYKKAVVSAEELFNRVLKMANFSGSNTEDRLRMVPDKQLEFKDDIIWAYKLKKMISEDENFEVEHEEAKRAVYIFERTLKEMRVF
ncbi:MAG: hypothetical protein U9P70_04240 [Patescibacteria group bacterium]|nr:hypothetical protein [Patescibacteria group bacterium]